jgi:hypothetical protein
MRFGFPSIRQPEGQNLGSSAGRVAAHDSLTLGSA